MSRSIPTWLVALRADLDLKAAGGQPTGVARLILMILLAHAGKEMLAWPSVRRLAKIAGVAEAGARAALRLLEERKAIERNDNRPSPAWRILLANPNARARVFWPVPRNGDGKGEQTVAIRALLAKLGSAKRNRVAVIFLLYQFAPPQQLTGGYPVVPTLAWVARVLGTTYDTVRRAKKDAIDLRIATENDDGLLTFEDPGRWPEILGICTDSQDAATGDSTTAPPRLQGPVSSSGRSGRGSCGEEIPLSEDVSSATCKGPAANTGEYPAKPKNMSVGDPLVYIDLLLRRAGYVLPGDVLAHEILTTHVEQFGIWETVGRLWDELNGPDPSYALDALGAELGEEYECPRQLIRWTPGVDGMP